MSLQCWSWNPFLPPKGPIYNFKKATAAPGCVVSRKFDELRSTAGLRKQTLERFKQKKCHRARPVFKRRYGDTLLRDTWHRMHRMGYCSTREEKFNGKTCECICFCFDLIWWCYVKFPSLDVVLLSICVLSRFFPHISHSPSQAVSHRIRRGATGSWRFFGRIHGRCIVSMLVPVGVDIFIYLLHFSNATAELISDSIICEYSKALTQFRRTAWSGSFVSLTSLFTAIGCLLYRRQYHVSEMTMFEKDGGSMSRMGQLEGR